ncbi:hypothetical protein HanPSC8_Chr12g0509921 [Helianthus annuus]|nr:hypothetical protein HanIR_Chr12g0570551 [Helianthus annuus]KAJ0861724.1 hypothetical protein HanPSC8_Chr12g0509921 [Helianthus annuus]
MWIRHLNRLRQRSGKQPSIRSTCSFCTLVEQLVFLVLVCFCVLVVFNYSCLGNVFVSSCFRNGRL